MLRELLRFEWRFHTRQPSFLAACALFLGLGFVLTATGFGANNLFVNAPYLIAESLAFASLFSVFAVAIFVSNAVLRDTENRFEEIVFTTPIGRFNYIASRCGGAFLAAATCLLLTPAGMLVASRMPWIDPARVTAIDVRAYVGPFLTLVLPTLLFVTAVLFAIAVKTRSAIATYTASIFIYLLYMAMAAMTGSPLMAASAPGAGGGSTPAIFDPFGMSAFFELTRYWAVAERNHRLIPLAGVLLTNRLLWIASSIAIAAATWRTFAFRTLTKKKERARKPDASPARHVDYFRASQAPAGWRASLRSYWSLARFESASALKSGPYLLLLAVWFVIMVVELRSDLFGGEYGSALYPDTSLIFGALQQPISIIGTIVILYYGAELLWREHRFRVAPLIDTTPVRSVALVLAKWTALVTLVAVAIVVAIAAGVLTQLTAGYTSIAPSLYVSLFWFALLPLAVFAAATVAIHSLSPGKYAGLVLTLLFAVATRRAPMLGLGHPLWRFGTGPEVTWSAFYGFSDEKDLYARLMLHWSAIAAAMLTIAIVAWRRLRDPATARLRHVLAAAARHKLAVAATLLLLAATGTLVFVATNIESPYRTRSQQLDWRAGYERSYRRFASVSQPKMIALTTAVDLRPAARRVSVSGTYTLRNESGASMRQLLITLPRDGEVRRLSVSSPARHVSDREFGVHTFELATPLAPGATTSLEFTVDYGASSLDEQSLADNGSVLMSTSAYPTLGYRPGLEINDAHERKMRGLGTPTQRIEGDAEGVDGTDASVDDRITLDATVSTNEGQTAITSGRLAREWSANGRRYFRYVSDAPILNRFAIASARYAFARRKLGNVDVIAAYLPQHHVNVPAMLDVATQTLETCSAAFGAYPHAQLKLVEVPANWSFGGLAMPDTILLPETRSFLVDSRDPRRPDLVLRRIAHETAHQWFGHQLVAANRSGASMLTESLTKYVELLVLERIRGVDSVRQLLGLELDRYLAGRAKEDDRERPLAATYNQSYIYYAKGATVMHAIRDLIGEQPLNAALRHLIERNGRVATATTGQLLHELRAVSNDAQFALISEWMQKITLYDLRIADVHVAPSRVVVKVAADKFESSPDGTETRLPLAEAIDVAVYGGDPDDSKTLLASKRVPMHNGVNEVTFDVPGTARYVVVDPLLLRIDKNRFDNVKPVK